MREQGTDSGWSGGGVTLFLSECAKTLKAV